jgi:ABC-2 type transport system permease protein
MYFAAKVITSMIFSANILGVLLLLGSTAGGVRMPFSNLIQLMATLVAGSLPFSAMGLALGYFTGPNSAPATIDLIYLPMSFCSGLWVPFMFLPKILRQIALVLPPYHLSQLALGMVGAGNHESAFTHWEVLLAFTMICLGFARFGFQRDQKKMYG